MAKSTENVRKGCIGFFSSFLSLLFIFLTFIEGFAEFNHASASKIDPNVSVSNTLTDDDVSRMKKSQKELKTFVRSKIKDPEKVKVSSKVSNKISKNDKIAKDSKKIYTLKKIKSNKQTESEDSSWLGWVLGGVIGLATLVGEFFLIRNLLSKNSTNPIHSASQKQKSNIINNENMNNNIVINNSNIDDNSIIANDSNGKKKSVGNVANRANNIKSQNHSDNNFLIMNNPVNENNIFENNQNIENPRSDNMYLEDDDLSDIIISNYGIYSEDDSRIIDNPINRSSIHESNENVENSNDIENAHPLNDTDMAKIMSNYGNYSGSDFQIIDGPINGYNESNEDIENPNNIENADQPWNEASVNLDYSDDEEPKLDGSVHFSRMPSFESIYISQNPSI